MDHCIRTINYEDECIHALGRIAEKGNQDIHYNWSPLPDILDYYINKYNLSQEDRATLLDPVLDVYKHIESHITLTEQELKKYFAPLLPKSYSPALLMLHINDFNSFENCTEEELLRKRIHLVFTYLFQDALEDEKIPVTIQELLLAMNKFDDKLNDSVKFRILDLILSYDEYWTYIQSVIPQVIALFKEKEAALLPLINSQCDMLDSILEQEQGTSNLLKSVGFMLDDVDAPVHISIMGFSSVRIHSDTFSEEELITQDNTYISFGILVHYFCSLEKNPALSSAVVIKKLKVISDKTRFEILCLLKDGGKYGQELANLLNLTPATISHHMNELASASLVNLEFDGTRINYQVNHETLKELIDSLQKKII